MIQRNTQPATAAAHCDADHLAGNPHPRAAAISNHDCPAVAQGSAARRALPVDWTYDGEDIDDMLFQLSELLAWKWCGDDCRLLTDSLVIDASAMPTWMILDLRKGVDRAVSVTDGLAWWEPDVRFCAVHVEPGMRLHIATEVN